MPPAYPMPVVVGHRGAAALAPENTLAGLDAAAAAGCCGVEVDVMLSADGQALLHHDLTLQRTARARGRVPRLTLAALAAYDVGGYFHPRFRDERIPTLAQALERVLELGLAVNLEIKPARGVERETARRAVETVRALWPADRPGPLISSFKRSSLAVARDLAPELPRALISDRRPRDWRRSLADLGCTALHLSRRSVSLATIEELRRAGYAVGVYTVNDPLEARIFRAWGVDCVISDSPDVTARALAGAV